MFRSTNLDHVALHEQVRLMGGQCPLCQAGRMGCPCGGTCARCRQEAGAFEGIASDAFEDTVDDAFEDLADEGALGALAGLARIGGGVGRLGAGVGRIASSARAVTAPLRSLGRIGAGAGRVAARARGLAPLARLPGRAVLGRLPGRAALGRIPGRSALGRIPSRAALGRIPSRTALGRIPGRAASGRIPGRAGSLPARLRALARRQLRAQMRAGGAGIPPDDAPPATGQTPPQTGGPFGEFQGWSNPVSLQTLLTDRRTAAGRALDPQIVRQFFRPGRNLYRITVNTPSGPQTQYLNIGMTGKNIATRLREHYAGTGDLSLAERKLHEIMHAPGVDPSNISVQAANLPDQIPPRLAHMFEIWLQHRERVSDWPDIQNTRTFEEDDEDANEAYTDLQVAG